MRRQSSHAGSLARLLASAALSAVLAASLGGCQTMSDVTGAITSPKTAAIPEDPKQAVDVYGDRYRANRSRGNLSVGHGDPAHAVVLRLPHAAAGRSHVEDVGLRSHAGGRRRSSASRRADRSPAEVLIRIRVDDDVRIRLRDRARTGSRVAEDDDRQRRHSQQQELSTEASLDEATILLLRHVGDPSVRGAATDGARRL